MNEHPILFSGPMVRAILAGTKTQTRRIVPRLPSGMAPNCYIGRNEGRWNFTEGGRGGDVHGLLCRYGTPGDQLWVRETWAETWTGEADVREVSYRASTKPGIVYLSGPGGVGWRPSIFLRRADSRITLDVTGVRADRLQDITEDDIRAEGVSRESVEGLIGRPVGEPLGASLRGLWSMGWDAINGKRAPWASNPWVWVVSFARTA